MYALFWRLVCVAMLVVYLTQSPDRGELNEPAAWTENLLTLWQNSAIKLQTDDWWQIEFMRAYLVYIGLISREEDRRAKGFVWEWVYKRAVGRPDRYDPYFGPEAYLQDKR